MIEANISKIKKEIGSNVKLIAVSKTQPIEKIQKAYESGHKIFGENKVQELCNKQENLPKDIEWHLIGHLQSNKVKYIAPFVSLIHSIDSQKLLEVVNKEGIKNNRVIDCLLQIHVATEETKFGFDEKEIALLLTDSTFKEMKNVRIRGLMGMATFTEDIEIIRSEFRSLKKLYDSIKSTYFKDEASFDTLSMGMSSDYLLAIEEGSNMIRVGSSIFGDRNY